MGNLSGKYDPNAEAQQDFGKWPTGEYAVQIVDSDVKPNNSNTGEYAELVYEAIDGPLKGRKLWCNVTLTHTNQVAQDIGQRQMASIREATGVHAPQDTQDFHYKPHVIRVEFYPTGSVITSGKKKGQTRDRDENEVKAWKKLDGAMGNAPTQPTAAATGASPSSPPWAQRNAA